MKTVPVRQKAPLRRARNGICSTPRPRGRPGPIRSRFDETEINLADEKGSGEAIGHASGQHPPLARSPITAELVELRGISALAPSSRSADEIADKWKRRDQARGEDIAVGLSARTTSATRPTGPDACHPARSTLRASGQRQARSAWPHVKAAVALYRVLVFSARRIFLPSAVIPSRRSANPPRARFSTF